MAPSQRLMGFSRVAAKGVDLGRPEVARINLDNTATLLVIAFFFDTLSSPFHMDIKLASSDFNELTYTVLHARCNDKIFGVILL